MMGSPTAGTHYGHTQIQGQGTVKDYLAWDNMVSLKCFYNNIFAHVELLANLRPNQDGIGISKQCSRSLAKHRGPAL